MPLRRGSSAGRFYALFFLTQALKVDAATANILVAVSLLIGTPFFVIFGALSDKIGRKPIIMAGCLLAALTYFPVFSALTKAANPDLAAAQAKTQVVVTADPKDCSFQGSPIAPWLTSGVSRVFTTHAPARL